MTQTPISYRIERTRNRHSRAVLQSDTIVIRLARNLSAVDERQHIENLVRRMVKMLRREQERIRIDPFFPLTDEQVKNVEMLVHDINAATLNVPINKIHLRPMSTQWGSCSSRGHISLNTALLKLPRHLLEYVIIHELAHRKVKNHSRAFWSLVESVCPGARSARREMLKYRLQKRSC